MSVLNFPAADQSPWVAPNGSTYVYVGTEPNGYWKGSKGSPEIGDGAITITQDGEELGSLASSTSQPEERTHGDKTDPKYTS